jgi:hypothetical protein
MTKVVFLALLLVTLSFTPVLASETFQGPVPEKMLPPEKCAGCHNIQNTYQELLLSSHNDLK